MGIIVQGKGLWRALFTRTQRRLLGLLYGYPERSFFANELVRLAGVGTGSVQRELGRLAEAGILSVTRIGNQKHFQANPDCPFFPELRSIVVKTFGAMDRIRSSLRLLEPPPALAFLHGDASTRLEPGQPLGLVVVGAVQGREALEAVLEPVSADIGRPFELTLLARDRFFALLAQPNERFQALLEAPRVMVLGAWPAGNGTVDAQADLPTG